MKMSLSIFPFCPFCWQNEMGKLANRQNEQNEMVKLANWQNEQNEMVKLANWQSEQNEQNENVFVDFPILPILLAE